MDSRPILVASHGTPGARAAEAAAIALSAPGAILHHLVVVPGLWRGMTGDDWLNNAVTQLRYGSYVEDQLEREMMAEVDRLQHEVAAAGLVYQGHAAQGEPGGCLIDAAQERDYRLVVIGAPRPKGAPGLRSRIDLDRVSRRLGVPLLIVPHPGA